MHSTNAYLINIINRSKQSQIQSQSVPTQLHLMQPLTLSNKFSDLSNKHGHYSQRRIGKASKIMAWLYLENGFQTYWNELNQQMKIWKTASLKFNLVGSESSKVGNVLEISDRWHTKDKFIFNSSKVD